MNVGKRFENNFRDSVPDDVLYYRLRDSAQSFGAVRANSEANDTLRFSLKNPCDCFLFKSPVLYALELKSVGSTSISFERSELEHGVIHFHQIEGLRDFAKHKNCIAGFLLNFRRKDESETCYFLHINDFLCMISNISKKSFNEKDLAAYHPIVIKSRKKIVNYDYDVADFMHEAKSLYL